MRPPWPCEAQVVCASNLKQTNKKKPCSTGNPEPLGARRLLRSLLMLHRQHPSEVRCFTGPPDPDIMLPDSRTLLKSVKVLMGFVMKT